MPRKNYSNTKPIEGVYDIDSDRLSYAYVSGTYSDQGCITVTWDDKLPKAWHPRHNHKGGDFKIHPELIVNFLRKIGVSLHFDTDRKHSYCRSIELKPWSEFEQAMRHTVDNTKSETKIKE